MTTEKIVTVTVPAFEQDILRYLQTATQIHAPKFPEITEFGICTKNSGDGFVAGGYGSNGWLCGFGATVTAALDSLRAQIPDPRERISKLLAEADALEAKLATPAAANA